MPFHLPAITRRDFLAGSIGTVAVAAGRTVYASGKPDPYCFALLSDPHIAGDPENKSRNINMTQRLKGILEKVSALETPPSGVIFCGDLAFNKGEIPDYRQFSSLLGILEKADLPVHLLLGNHDHRGNFHSVLKEHRPDKPVVQDKHVSIVPSPRANWFLLDSLNGTNSTPGLLGGKQLGWLDGELSRRTDRPAVVMAHHDPWHPREKPETFHGLQDSDEMMKVLLKHEHVKAYLHGHTHRWGQSVFQGLHIVSLPTSVWVFDKSQPRGWILARLNESDIMLELSCLHADHALHGQKITLGWRR